MSRIQAAAVAALLLPAAAPAQELPVVKLFTTGGTIQSLGKDRLKLAEYREGRIDGETIVEAVPEASRLARIEVQAISAVSSVRMGAEQGLPLARQLMTELERPEVAGAVVTPRHHHPGGDGLLPPPHRQDHETGGRHRFDAALDRGQPRRGRSISWARSAPCSPRRPPGKGVLVLLNDTIHSARFVTKRHTYHIETFVSPDVGPLGFADADRVVLYRSPVTRHTADTEFELDGIEELPQVDVVYGYQEASRAPIDALVKEGAKGIVLADSAPAHQNAVLEALAAGVVVVRGSRKGAGRVVLSDRTAARSEITADNLHPQKARILLRLALTRTTDARELQRIFNEY